MNEKELRDAVQRVILTELARLGEAFVPVSSSNHHIHLSQADVEALFGAGHRLTGIRDLVQPGQFACEEQVVIETPKGKMKLRVVGPARKETQIELSRTDAFKLGLKPPLRMSGNLAGSPGCVITNGEKRIEIRQGVIIAARHLHLSPDEAAAYDLRDGDVVSLKFEGERGGILDNVIVRSGEGHRLEAHIDTDEANAFFLRDGQLCRVIRNGADSGDAKLTRTLSALLSQQGAGTQPAIPQPPASQPAPAPQPEKKRETMLDLSREPRRLITEDDVRQAALSGYRIIRYAKDAIWTPLARDTAYEKGIETAEAL
ncbi:MAG: phosphate propanoyltransferase [Clostridiales bacterium]|nr:phosphate propanoyltransferase [Clostridiales bacterium]